MAYQSNGKSSGAPGKDDDKKIFVGALGRNTGESDIRNYFSQFGEITGVDVKIDPVTHQSRGFGFVQFSEASSALTALSSGDHYISGKKIDVKKVTKKASPLKCKLFVGGLNQDITEEDIRNYFSQYGDITEFQQPFDKEKNIRKGYCFITFSDVDAVTSALISPKQVLKGKEVDVKRVKFNPETMGPPGVRGAMRGGMGGGFGMGRGGYGNFGTPNAYAQGGYAGYPAASSYENYGPAYGGYDYSQLGYGGDNGYGGQGGYGGGKYRDNSYTRPAPY